jgi:hypothetical protein
LGKGWGWKMGWEVVVVISRLWAVRSAHHAKIGRVMVLVVFEIVSHLVGCSRESIAASNGDPAVEGADLQKQDKECSAGLGKTFYIA